MWIFIAEWLFQEKLQSIALQQSEYLGQLYIEEQSVYDPETLISLNETGAEHIEKFHKSIWL